MSALVRRCPTCGSTQDAAGVCDTCHDADVRLFCANHAPGRWLDAPPCPACGATLDAGPARRPAPPPVPPPAPVPEPVREAPPSWRPHRPVVIEDARPEPPLGGWRLPERPPIPVVRVGLPSVAGCLGRLLLLALVLLVLAGAAFAWLLWG
ncbi:hypothetical protein [Roseisolibacter sp. H3M3-2]|uniref:hypothetical protein n=1 Tax=Roseisolibacter sp. H3M3-2 TaxID=3031323 RepID=UPI0023DA31DB|nr:hypothetical protein [Roseisolibacter sp. H3M3-2]MDF1501709.1 hypothetical protein [Roseisolibacter sp. H3M3-2]